VRIHRKAIRRMKRALRNRVPRRDLIGT
jgi:hypothetical protein